MSFDESSDWSGKLILEFYSAEKLMGTVSRPITVMQGTSSDLTVNWQPPATDFRGYLVKAYIEGKPDAFQTSALDVSSDWTHFPRYGYTTEFPKETAAQSEEKIKQLSQDYFLNGYQFYDWMWRHDVSVYSQTYEEDGRLKPVVNEQGQFVTAPMNENTSYLDLLGRPLFPLSVKQQIEASHKYGSAAMAYQMNYAAREHYEDYGVKREWGLYNKNTQFPNPDPIQYQNGFYFDWVNTGLYLQDPGNPQWQSYITNQYNRSINEFKFDGIHLDQWGANDNDFLYSYDGKERYYSKDYDSLINSVKDSLTKNDPTKNHVTFNMVGGSQEYADVPNPNTKTDFDYSEIWQNRDNYRDLKSVIDDTKSKDGGKAMVIAGYMNYKQATGDKYPAADLTDVPKTVEFQSRINRVPGWVGDFGMPNEDKIIWTVHADQAGTYDLTLNYGHGNAGGSPDGKLTVNGEVVATSIPFDENTGWGNPSAKKMIHANLKAGDNTIMLQLNSTGLWLNVDSLVVAGDGKSREYEAEYADLVSCRVDRFGNVFFFETEGDYVTFDVVAEANGDYPIAVNYGIASTQVTRDLYVNGELVKKDAEFAPTGGWETFKTGKSLSVPLHAGHNSVTLQMNQPSDTGMTVNYLEVASNRYEAEKASYGWKPTRETGIQLHPGVVDSAYVKNLNNAPDSIEFDVASETEGMQELIFQYATQNSPKGIVTVNGTILPGEVAFDSTGGWGATAGNGHWGWKSVMVPLHPGTNTVKLSLTTGGQYLNLDGILVGGQMFLVNDRTPINGTTRVSVAGGVEVNESADKDVKTDNFNGAGGKSVTFEVYAPKASDYSLGLWYRTGNAQTAALDIDGASSSLSLPSNDWYNGWWGVAEKNIALSEGYHSITVRAENNDTWLNVHALSMGRKLESESPQTRTNGVDKTSHSTDNFGEAGDSISMDVNRAEAGWDTIHVAYRSNSAIPYTMQVNSVSQQVYFSNTSGTWSSISVPLNLAAGQNKLTLYPTVNGNESIEIDKLTLDDIVKEAESAEVRKGGNAVAETKWSTIGYLDHFGQKGDFVSLKLSAVGESGLRDLIVTYRNPGASATRSIYLDGKKLGSFEFQTSGDWTELLIPSVYVSKELTHTLKMKMEQSSEDSGLAIDSFKLNGVTFEAESGEIGWEPVVAKTGSIQTVPGRTDNHGLVGQTLTFHVDAAEAVQKIAFKYRTDNNPKFDVFVDNTQIADDITFGQTPGGWSGGMAEKAIDASLAPGAHQIKLVVASDRQYINLDSLIVGDREYEVEDADISGGAEALSISKGFASGFDDENDFLKFEVTLDEDRTEDLTWAYSNNGLSGKDAIRTMSVINDGEEIVHQELAFPHTNDWSELVTPGVQLKKGVNLITLRLDGHDDEGINLDYVKAGSIRIDGEKADFTPAMTLYKDLLLNFGHLGDEATFDIQVEQAGETSLIFSYANSGAAGSKTLYIDGVKTAKLDFRSTGSSTTFDEDVYYIVPYLSQGAHQVTLKHESDNEGSIDLRSLTIGFFNEPSIRLMDAVLGAFGTTHIELGTAAAFEEGPNMLAHEYYPNRSKKMKASLKESLKDYYKFYAAYENLLFDSTEDNQAKVSVKDADGNSILTSADGKEDSLLTVVRKTNQTQGFGKYDVLNFVNLLNNDANWRNAASEPEHLSGLNVTYDVGVTQGQAPNLQVYAASPDHEGGMFTPLNFKWEGSKITFTMPTLAYWNMVFVKRDAMASDTPSDSGSHSNSSAGGGAANFSSANTVTISASDFNKLGGNTFVKLSGDQQELKLPLDAGKLLGKGNLEISQDKAKLVFSAQLLEQVRTLISSESAGNAAISIRVKPATDDLKNAAADKLKGNRSLTATQLGNMYDFEIGVDTGSGFAKWEKEFDSPVTLELSVDGEVKETELLGLYTFDVNKGQWIYAGGKYDEVGHKLIASMKHFSLYAPIVWKSSFNDVDDQHWAHRSIQVLAAKQVIQGRSAAEFEPGSTTTRAEFVTMLARALGVTAEHTASSTFRDLVAGSWYANAAAAAVDQGWVSGRTNESFEPDAPITREEMAVILSRVYKNLHGAPAEHGETMVYSDVDDISDWALDAVQQVLVEGLMQGRQEQIFAPAELTTRAEVATVIYRLLQTGNK
ncbi:S-layer homology domain-containing protein [Paenibacillus hexagrammi]|uniref:S-layer homology domain-containing protein n=1 Tax=Paenibacillus hexagrammi TaxID=2908839 RepID=A0ABY3STC5_9BACL|nr:S-layer homology domain-containing protein [Paenibacillus sp. YPD9-1]